MVRIAVSGATGRMGQLLARLAAEAGDVELVGGVARVARDAETARSLNYPRITSVSGAAEILAAADVLVDFSTPEQLGHVLDTLEAGSGPSALVVGTTGLGAGTTQRLEEAATERAVLAEANFSVGVQLLLALVKLAAGTLPAVQYDVEVVETHHRMKVDAPSGTALALADAVAAGRAQPLEALRRDGRTGRPGVRPEGEIGLHALRGGAVVGDHSVCFLGQRERLDLSHSAMDRAVFAEGALLAARWLRGRPPGRYQLRQALGFS